MPDHNTMVAILVAVGLACLFIALLIAMIWIPPIWLKWRLRQTSSWKMATQEEWDALLPAARPDWSWPTRLWDWEFEEWL